MAQSGQRLLLLACSQRKRPDSDALPAIERYDGPAFRVVRRFLRASACASLRIAILSAEFGLIAPDDPIPVYDRRMTPERAQELQPSVTRRLRQIEDGQGGGDLFVCAGRAYLAALAGWIDQSRPASRLQLAAGPPGRRLSALHSWLYSAPTDAPQSEAQRFQQQLGVPAVRV